MDLARARMDSNTFRRALMHLRGLIREQMFLEIIFHNGRQNNYSSY